MRRLFVNADDFGLTEGVSRGILHAMTSGVVGGTTAMVCAPGGLERITRLGKSLAGRLGLHLQLTGGRPCLPAKEIPTLVTAEGTFPRKKTDVKVANPDEVRREWKAQLARFRETGLEPSHLDAHHHIHNRPDIFPVFLELAQALGIPGRALSDTMRRQFTAAGIPHAALCITRFYGENLTKEHFLEVVKAAFSTVGPEEIVELMAHPGQCDATLTASSTYSEGREEELRVLTEPGLAETLRQLGIALAGPSALAKATPPGTNSWNSRVL